MAPLLLFFSNEMNLFLLFTEMRQARLNSRVMMCRLLYTTHIKALALLPMFFDYCMR